MSLCGNHSPREILSLSSAHGRLVARLGGPGTRDLEAREHITPPNRFSTTSIWGWDAVVLPVANTPDQDGMDSCAFIPHGFTNINVGGLPGYCTLGVN